MSLVSLIPVAAPHESRAARRLEAYRSRLERAGYRVATEEDPDESAGSGPSSRPVGATVDRLRSAAGTFLIVVDPARAFGPDDVVALVRRLDAGDLDLVIAARPGRRYPWAVRRPARAIEFEPDPGLFGLSRAAARGVAPPTDPGAGWSARDLQAAAGGRWAVLPVASFGGAGVGVGAALDLIRRGKRVADRRLGNVSRFAQFCAVGASGMIIDLSMYAALQAILARTWLGSRTLFPPGTGGATTTPAVAIAAVLAIVIAMTWNFSLNRRLTFDDARPGSVARQYCRYALSNLVGCGVSLGFRLLLPIKVPFFGRHRLAAAVAGIVAATGISFTLARWFVFGVRPHRPRLEAPFPRSPTPAVGE